MTAGAPLFASTVLHEESPLSLLSNFLHDLLRPLIRQALVIKVILLLLLSGIILESVFAVLSPWRIKGIEVSPFLDLLLII